MNFRILGTLQAEVDGRLVDLGPPKQRSLLALLLLNGNQTVATDRLIDLIWGEAPSSYRCPLDPNLRISPPQAPRRQRRANRNPIAGLQPESSS